MMKGNASNSNMASALTQRTGIPYSYLDVYNLVKRISDDEYSESIEEYLAGIRESGGTVVYRKKTGTNDVYVIYVQTKSMKAHLSEVRPNTYEMDTTFSTNKENFKMWVPVYKSFNTDKWEIAGFLFLESETLPVVEEGIKMFKESLPYTLPQLYFFTDKDFEYIHVSKNA